MQRPLRYGCTGDSLSYGWQRLPRLLRATDRYTDLIGPVGGIFLHTAGINDVPKGKGPQ